MQGNGGHEVLVRMQGIEKMFPGVHALNNCQFELLAGEVHALVGENGAGKSTLMKVLTGVYQKDGGDIYICGQKVDIPDTRPPWSSCTCSSPFSAITSSLLIP